MAADSNSGDPISDYTRTQRIVLLIDLNPLLHLQDPTRFRTSLLSSIKTLTSFPPLSFSLFAVRPFFSSLSLQLSSSTLPSSSLSLSFDSPDSTLRSLSETLDSLSFDRGRNPSLTAPKASSISAAMRQLVHDYAWDPVVIGDAPATSTFSNCDGLRSNLVVLFSPLCGSSKFVSEFLNLGLNDENIGDLDLLSEKFRGVFRNVDEAFVSRDIQLSWIDVRFELEYDVFRKCGVFEKMIRSLGWGFCSSDSIVLGSALVPFGLIYPEIGVSSNVFECKSRKARAQLNLEILDVMGKPLECKFCDVELADLRMLRRSRGDDGLFLVESVSLQRGHEMKRLLWGSVGDGVSRIQIKALQKDDEFVKFKGWLSDPVLVYEVAGRDGKGVSRGFFVDKVLEMASVELGEFGPRKLVPVWQILLSFLYRDGCVALLSISNDSGVLHTGILKPFTASSALLFILDEGFRPHRKVPGIGAVNVGQSCLKMKNEICSPDVDLNNLCGSQTEPSQSNKSAEFDGKKKSRKRNSHSLQELTWCAFCKKAFELSDLQLEEVYFARHRSSSKKLKFLKCWMKQIKALKYPIMEETVVHQENRKEMANRLDALQQEIEQPMSSGTAADESLPVAFGIQDEASQEYRIETSEAFFSKLSSKIRQGLESEAIDLGDFASRLVSRSIYWLNLKHVTTTPSENQSLVKFDCPDDLVAAELLELLLRDPKDMVARHKSYDPSLQASDPGSETFISETIVREYELQILFRMEILQSEVGASIKDSVKQKLVKHNCMLLETVRDRCHLKGGFFGDWTLENYAGKIIKSRYRQTLEDVVHKIYRKMDLLLFDDEEELPINLFNSEDSNQSYREKPGKEEVGENSRIKELASAEDESPDLLKHYNGRPSAQVVEQEEHARKMIEAQESRERARRFSYFTSRVADLQRVRAVKQPKAFKPKSNSLTKPVKRKDHADSYCERVLETPMSENKRIHIDDKDYQDYGSRSVSKSLFQED